MTQMELACCMAALFVFVFFDYRGVADKTGKWH